MNILLSYSKTHFDPFFPKEKFSYSSAGILAKMLYEELIKMGSVTYIDKDDWQAIDLLEGKEFDLFVGIAQNFVHIVNNIKCDNNILFAVNNHPKERVKKLKDYMENKGIPEVAMASWDIPPKQHEEAVKVANKIICLGNEIVINSYLKHGVKRENIIPFTYGTLKPIEVVPKKSGKFLYVASEIGLRKGFDQIVDFFSINKYPLVIVGSTTNEYYEKRMQELLTNNQNVEFKGWIDSATEEYKKILQGTDFVIMPSVEEGLCGSVLDAMSQGCIPIVNLETGIVYNPLGKLKKETIDRAVVLDENDVIQLKRKTIEFYKDYYYKNRIGDILREWYPKLSVILPIFNKEKTIKELIKLLDKRCKEYKNIECHVIFDGCADNSEEIVKKELKNAQYNIKYYTTPDIFEVKTNNLGMRASTGKYCIILQDDSYLPEENLFFNIADTMMSCDKIGVLGCLTGVNFYPKGCQLPKGTGQQTSNDRECYWRQDEKTDASLKEKIFETDACMRAPLVFRKDLLEKHGYLDEIYCPLYNDDMDYCFRMRSLGYKVVCRISDVENRCLTQANYSPKRIEWFDSIIKEHTGIFYSRWRPSAEKDYAWWYR